ncbi:MAG: sulfatase-like hydrolase/transferase [Candidatus Brocadiia bacterium]
MPNNKPNMVLCMCDQLRAHAVGCYGNDHVRTPNIDRLATMGTRFDLAFTPNPVCTPARSATITGQYSRTCAGMLGNVHRNPPNPERVRLLGPTLPEIFGEHGYETALIGKWHMGPRPEMVGFETALYPKVAHHYYGQTYFNERAESIEVEEFAGDWEIDRVREFLESRAGCSEPFFLFHNISQPHQPIGPGHLPDRYVNMFDPNEVPLRPNTMEDGEPSHSRWWFSVYRSADFFWRDVKGEPQDPKDIAPEDFDLRSLTALYYGAIACVDDQLGEMMLALEKNHLADDTIVVFISDHGDNLGSHGLFNKNSLIEESIHIPMVVYDPRQEPGEDTETIASLIDVAPSLLEMIGVEIPAHIQGRSLAPSVRDNGMPEEENLAFIETGPMIGVRTPSHLYGMQYDEENHTITDGEEWFFDLTEDPYEMNNLAESGERDGLQEELRQKLLEWDESTPWLDAPRAERIIE